MVDLQSIFCKVNANSDKLLEFLGPHSSFRFQYRLLTMTTFFEIAVYTDTVYTCGYLFLSLLLLDFVHDKKNSRILGESKTRFWE